MDILFTQLLSEIEKFLDVAKLSFSKLSPLGIDDEKTGDLPREQKYWQGIIDETQQQYTKLQTLLNLTPEVNLGDRAIDQRLIFFREIPRRISEAPPEWSAYYPEIQKCLGDMYSTRVAIEKKYFLGQHMKRGAV